MRLEELPPHSRERVKMLDRAQNKPPVETRRFRHLDAQSLMGPLHVVRAVVVGQSVVMWLPIDPPTATHHAKKIARFGRRTGLIDAPALKAARMLYLSVIPQCPGSPIAGPYALAIQFRFARGATKRPRQATKRDKGVSKGVPTAENATEGICGGLTWRTKKPDVDNLAKTLTDCLVAKGWIERDEQVVRLTVEKMDVAVGGAGIAVRVSRQTAEPILGSEP